MQHDPKFEDSELGIRDNLSSVTLKSRSRSPVFSLTPVPKLVSHGKILSQVGPKKLEVLLPVV